MVEIGRLELHFGQSQDLEVEGFLQGTDDEKRCGGIGTVELAVEAATEVATS